MNATATLLVTNGGESVTPDDRQIPIADINIVMIQRRQEVEAQASVDQVRQLFGKASPYAFGVGDVLQITIWSPPELTATQGCRLRQMGAPMIRPGDL